VGVQLQSVRRETARERGGKGDGEGEGELTWMKAVEMMTPVPNCLRIVRKMLERTWMKWDMRIGPNTPAAVSFVQGMVKGGYEPMELAAKTTKSMPMRMPIL
jgi:hypothetical protein